MRVVIVSKTFVAETAQRQLEWIAQQPDIELTLVTPPFWRSDDGRRLPFAPHFISGYQVRKVPVAFNGQYHFYFYPGLGAVVREQRPDVLHIDEEPYNPAGAQAQRIANAVGARTVFVSWQNLYRTYPAPYAWIERYNYRHAAAIIAGSAEAGEVLRRKGYNGPTAVFPVRGVDPDIYRPVPRTSSSDTVVIGYLGRLVLSKGMGLLIEALQGMPDYCRLRLVGSGPDERALRHLASEHGVVDRVEFVPAVPSAEVPRALAAMDVLAAPSLTQPNWKEQFGRVLVEAMACGIPVIGSDSGAIPQVIGGAGMIVPEGDVEALRVGLLRIAKDAAMRERFSRAGRAWVQANFTQEQVARKTVAVYREALGQ
jgi:glycosyltransferase involved in cell wall biosynthesis